MSIKIFPRKLRESLKRPSNSILRAVQVDPLEKYSFQLLFNTLSSQGNKQSSSFI
ncbi:7414_t:CDS:1, partial [Funneliformis geosporum]